MIRIICSTIALDTLCRAPYCGPCNDYKTSYIDSLFATFDHLLQLDNASKKNKCGGNKGKKKVFF